MLFYAFGGRAPSAKPVNDQALYELALDMHKWPEELRRLERKNPRDFNKLMLVNQGRKAGKRQIANNNKLETTCVLEL